MKYTLLLFAWVVCSCANTTAQTYPIVRTTGKLPALYFGLGEDRLGGAKLGYLDSGVLLTIVDSAKEMYKVQLSANHSAYIEKKSIQLDSTTVPKKQYLTASMNAKGDSAVDYVGIAMEERLPYQTNMVTSPAAIELDIYGVHSNTNWVTQLRSLKEVKNVYYKQIEDDVVRVTIELVHRQHWGYSVGYKGKYLIVAVKRQPAKLDIRKLTIGIDAGHGGTNVGTGGIKTQRAEKDLTLLYAKELQKWLKKKGVANVIMTREMDTTYDNKDRILFFQQQKPDLLISLHFNSSANQQVRGVSTYYKHIGFRPLTQYVLNRMLELNLNEFGNIGHFNFALNAPTDFPNCLVEIAFLSNEDDERMVVQPGFKTAVAQKIYSGINDWIKSLK